MDGEAAKKNLYEAATTGEVARFIQLLEQDPYLVDVASFACSRNILHIATMHGQQDIVEEVTRRNPQLAQDLDSQKSSPLHIAAAKGYIGIVAILLRIAPEMCWWRDCQGMNPVHIAAMNGHVHILEELLRLDSSPAMERLHRGQTVLHLCVKHRWILALKALAEKLGALVCAMDDDGETLLHLAVRCNQFEIIQYLVERNIIEKHTPNSKGKTALQILKESPTRTTHYSEIEGILKESFTNYSELKAAILPRLTDITMVVVILIATMAFQAAVNPPGGVWQDDTSSHRAGEAVMASTRPKIYKHFVRANTTAFISSLVTIFLITTGLSSQNMYVLLITVYAMWVSLASIVVSYGASILVITPNTKTKSLVPIIRAVVVVSASILGFVWVNNLVWPLYLSWKAKKRRQEDLTADSLIRRLFYWIFQKWERYCEDRTFLAEMIRIRRSLESAWASAVKRIICIQSDVQTTHL